MILEKIPNNISVIIVTYNRLNYLKLTVESVLAQSIRFKELLIVCDGHQEDVKDYISSLNDERILYHYVNHCGYPAKGRNLGLQLAKGDYIAFCDDDDLWMPQKLRKQMAVFQNDPSVGLCFARRSIIDSNGDAVEGTTVKWIPRKPTVHNLLLTNYISYSSVVINKAVLQKTGIYMDDIRFKAVEDYHLWLRIALLSKIYFIDEVLMLYRVHNSNISDKQLSDGAKKNMLLYKDLFSKFKFSYPDKLKARLTVYSKFLTYKLLGK